MEHCLRPSRWCATPLSPVLGINTGRLGFLSLVDVNTIEQAVESLIHGKFAIDQRTILQVHCEGSNFGDFPFALNELTLLNRERNSMISVHTMVNGIFMNTYWADGLIVATPTGSTAYSLSCGGPIVMPDSGNFIVTPIAPHNLNARPFILSDQNVISLKPDGRDHQFLVNLDSRSFAIEKNEVLQISLAPFRFHLVNLFDQNFFTTIRNKLGWGLDKRN
jgi:NAD+ kinase